MAEVKKEVNKKLIIVTGFGPFKGHEDVNASWEAVRRLPNTLHFKNTQYILEKREVAVEYEAVDQVVEEIWARKPDLVIHCGVHGAADCIRVEKLAYNHNFRRRDYARKRLPTGSACLVNCTDGISNDVIRCRLNVDKIVSAIAETCECTPSTTTTTISNEIETTPTVLAEASTDVGNYLCGYIYLKSLDRNSRRTLFIHVPRIGHPFSSDKTAEVILKIIEECVRQIVEDMKNTC